MTKIQQANEILKKIRNHPSYSPIEHFQFYSSEKGTMLKPYQRTLTGNKKCCVAFRKLWNELLDYVESSPALGAIVPKD